MSEQVMEYYTFLNRVREDGQINMFAAAPLLQDAFELGRNDARRVLVSWMDWVNSDPSNRDI